MKKTLYLERSVSTGRDGHWTENLDLDGVSCIVVGTGPGSFAGIRSAIAFAQGYSLGCACAVLGLPSPCACAAQVFADRGVGTLAVVGDARQGKRWIALFDGYRMTRDVFQVDQSGLVAAIPGDVRVVTPDDARIGVELRAAFADRYLGAVLPTEDGLRAFAEANPAILQSEPLPIYLNPAVR